MNHRMALTAIAALILVSFTLTSQLPIANALPLMTVSIDVNPSVEIDVDEDLKVTDIRALNQDAESLIQNRWKGEVYDTVVVEYFQTLNRGGYLQDTDEVLFGYAWLDNKSEQNQEMQGMLQRSGQDAVEELNRETADILDSYMFRPASRNVFRLRKTRYPLACIL